MKVLTNFFLLCIVWISCTTPQQSETTPEKVYSTEDEIVYHLFQRSFYDSNGDHIGDLNGISQKLDYLKELGVTSILLLPLYKSIYYHNYFADDFKEIDPEYGTLDDYLNMIKEIHVHEMKLYMDMEVQYVTEKHPWYEDSFENPTSAYSDYVIYNGPDNTEPESIIFDINGLEGYDGQYLKITTVDVGNEKVKEYIYDLFKFWVDPNGDGNFEDGVDGFRIDHMMDDLDWKGIRTNMFKDFWAPLFAQLKAINPKLNIFGEQSDWNDYGEAYFTQTDVDMMFAFSVRDAFLALDKQQIINKTDSTLMITPEGKYQLNFIENHDTDRYASLVEQNPGKLRLGAFFNIFNKGIPTIYYGQELGMYGAGGFGKYGMTDANDIPRREAFEWYADTNGPGMAFWYKDTGVWWDETNVKPNDGISLEEQAKDPNSLFNFYKTCISVRKANSALSHGDLSFIANTNEKIVSFIRYNEQDAFLLVFNTADAVQQLSLDNAAFPESVQIDKGLSMVLSDGNTSVNSLSLTVAPYGYALWKVE